MEPLSIAALMAMIASAAVQYQSQVDAQGRQQEAIRNSLNAQEKLQREAEAKAMDTAKKFTPQDRMAEQAQLEAQITEGLITPVSESQAIRAEQQTTQGDVSGDYTTAKAKSDLNSVKSAETLARLLGKTTAANRLRMNEGIRLMDTGMAIDQLNSFSRGQGNADKVAIDIAGNEDPNMVLAGEALGILGSAGMMYSAANAGKGTADFSKGSLKPNSALNTQGNFASAFA